MSKIKYDITELNRIKEELVRARGRVKYLRGLEKEKEESIRMYLESNDDPGVKFGGQAIILEKKQKKIRNTQKNIENDTKSILKNAGVDDVNEVIELLNSIKYKEVVEVGKIKLKKIK